MWSKLIILLDPVKYGLLDGRDRKEVDIKGLEAFLFQVCIERLAETILVGFALGNELVLDARIGEEPI